MSDHIFSSGDPFSTGPSDWSEWDHRDTLHEQYRKMAAWTSGPSTLERSHSRDSLQKVGRPDSPDANIKNSGSQTSLKHSSVVSSWGANNIPALADRPDFPPSAGLLWDVFKTQRELMKNESDAKAHLAAIRGSRWTPAESLEDFTAHLLFGEELVCSDVEEAEIVFDCLVSRGVINHHKQINFVPKASDLKEWLKRDINLDELRLKRLEYIIVYFHELRLFNAQQFCGLHDYYVKENLPNEYYELFYETVVAKTLREKFRLLEDSMETKSRGRLDDWNKKFDYWKEQRIWQDSRWGDEYRRNKESAAARAVKPEEGLRRPESPTASLRARMGAATIGPGG